MLGRCCVLWIALRHKPCYLSSVTFEVIPNISMWYHGHVCNYMRLFKASFGLFKTAFPSICSTDLKFSTGSWFRFGLVLIDCLFNWCGNGLANVDSCKQIVLTVRISLWAEFCICWNYIKIIVWTAISDDAVAQFALTKSACKRSD